MFLCYYYILHSNVHPICVLTIELFFHLSDNIFLHAFFCFISVIRLNSDKYHGINFKFDDPFIQFVEVEISSQKKISFGETTRIYHLFFHVFVLISFFCICFFTRFSFSSISFMLLPAQNIRRRFTEFILCYVFLMKRKMRISVRVFCSFFMS